jgi:hypothetical protein
MHAPAAAHAVGRALGGVDDTAAVSSTVTNTIADEVAVLEAVRAALAAGRARQALTLLDGLEREGVSTTFAEERLGLRVIALSRAGLHDDAATLSTTFFARYPNSLLTARVQDALLNATR